MWATYVLVLLEEHRVVRVERAARHGLCARGVILATLMISAGTGQQDHGECEIQHGWGDVRLVRGRYAPRLRSTEHR